MFGPTGRWGSPFTRRSSGRWLIRCKTCGKDSTVFVDPSKEPPHSCLVCSVHPFTFSVKAGRKGG